jgi:hypothetical protein
VSRHPESANAQKQHILPISEIKMPRINSFLDSQNLPEHIRGAFSTATPATWKIAGRMTTVGVKYTTPLSPKVPVAHYDMKNAAMFILKHGVDKVNEMPTKIKEDRAKKTARRSYDPLHVFSDRRPNNG